METVASVVTFFLGAAAIVAASVYSGSLVGDAIDAAHKEAFGMHLIAANPFRAAGATILASAVFATQKGVTAEVDFAEVQWRHFYDNVTFQGSDHGHTAQVVPPRLCLAVAARCRNTVPVNTRFDIGASL